MRGRPMLAGAGAIASSGDGRLAGIANQLVGSDELRLVRGVKRP